MNNHNYHMVNKSPWPLLSSFSVMTTMTGMIMMLSTNSYWLLMVGIATLTMTMSQWWRDMIRESTFQGFHTTKVVKNAKIGMIMFILSEIMFFLSFFWAYLHSSLSPNIDIGMNWPPMNIKSFNPMNVPMLNTIILLSSGVSLTWAHSAIMSKNLKQANKSIKMTMILGIYFSLIQWYEYYEASFTISDSIYGSTFFMTTGFHGMHVIIGTMFILVMNFRLMKLQFSSNHHVGFECATWYWHFVDVVWLFLYILMYWWGN
uniref:Cytochrome c oxidase subunit 3 n=1 Tax=Darthula hardwickii TaxID=1264638 RepID=A0A0U1Z5U5_9HEMI|nr:cytochrome c oxidase subunit III [Darthula hardwickii]AJP09352.1 cytochrome c oxidase subunit III [Darthula hardwickii]